jgi:hypothetical protein
MTDWATAFQDEARASLKGPIARAPATLGEIWRAEWDANGLDTVTGIGKPLLDSYEELRQRTADITGMQVPELARQRGMSLQGQTLDGIIDTMGRIVDSLPDSQQKLLADYKDVRKRAREKAAETERQSGEIGDATYGLSGHSAAFLAGMARQMVDPINLALAPVGGPAKGPVLKWLGKEFLIGAGTQAVQEPLIAPRRAELGLETNSFENILQAGIGQAGFAGLLRGAAAAWRAGRRAAGVPDADLAAADLDAAAMHAEGEALTSRALGNPIDAAEAYERARQAINQAGPISGVAPTRNVGYSLEGPQPIIRADGSRIEARYVVVERASLIASHTLNGNENPAFPQALQPRDRTQSTSQLWVNDTAARLAPERLGPSPIAQEGAPIVGPDGIVESGNGRVLALSAAYERFPEKAAEYRAYLDQIGFTVDGFQEPVLVRVRQGDLPLEARIAFAQESNVASTASLSASERAVIDGRKLHEGIMELWQGGAASDGRNADFVRRFMAEVVSVQERGNFVDADGQLSAPGQARIEAAVVARAWGNDRITRQLTEETNPNSKMILGAFADAAPQVARLRSAIEDGRVEPHLDVSRALVQAFEIVEQARRTGQKLIDIVNQVDLERGAMADDVRAAVHLFFRNDNLNLPSARDTVADRIRHAVDQVLMHQGGGFFDDALDAAGILRAARYSTETIGAQGLSRADLAKLMGDAQQRPRQRTAAEVRSWDEIKAGQPFATIEEAYQLAAPYQGELIAVLRKAGIGEIKDPGIKKRDTLERKLVRKGYDDLTEVTNIVRGGVIFDQPADVNRFLAKARAEFDGTIIDEGWKTNEVGYTDRKLMFIRSDGMIGEVQLWDRQNYNAKSGGAKLYAARRDVEKSDPERAAQMVANELEYWKPVQAALSESWRSEFGGGPKASIASENALNASSSEMLRPSQPTSAASTGNQPRFLDSTNALDRSAETTASRLSQSNSLDVAGNMGRASDMRLAQGDAEIKARVNNLVDEIGEDSRLLFELDDGSVKEMTIRERMTNLADERKAIDELNACIASTGGRIPEDGA